MDCLIMWIKLMLCRFGAKTVCCYAVCVGFLVNNCIYRQDLFVQKRQILALQWNNKNDGCGLSETHGKMAGSAWESRRGDYLERRCVRWNLIAKDKCGFLGFTYFFKGKLFWKFDNDWVIVSDSSPLPSPQTWLGCPEDMETSLRFREN